MDDVGYATCMVGPPREKGLVGALVGGTVTRLACLTCEALSSMRCLARRAWAPGGGVEGLDVLEGAPVVVGAELAGGFLHLVFAPGVLSAGDGEQLLGGVEDQLDF